MGNSQAKMLALGAIGLNTLAGVFCGPSGSDSTGIKSSIYEAHNINGQLNEFFEKAVKPFSSGNPSPDRSLDIKSRLLDEYALHALKGEVGKSQLIQTLSSKELEILAKYVISTYFSKDGRPRSEALSESDRDIILNSLSLESKILKIAEQKARNERDNQMAEYYRKHAGSIDQNKNLYATLAIQYSQDANTPSTAPAHTFPSKVKAEGEKKEL